MKVKSRMDNLETRAILGIKYSTKTNRRSKYKSRLEPLSKEIVSRLLSDIQMGVCMVVEVKIYYITRFFPSFFFAFFWGGEG
jgi:hypothetical protein